MGLLAVPVCTLRADGTEIAVIRELLHEHEAIEILVGAPVSLSGKSGPAAQRASDFAHELAVAVAPTPVRLIDERFTTTQAQRNLTDAGVSTRQGRSVIDQAAAVIIVQHSLDAERASGTAPGQIVRTAG